MDKISSYAPVIIPTLCRYEHFKQCLESLMECTGANQTDVFIGLDYPSKSSHWDGYNKILSYLGKFRLNHKFKSVTIIKREYNYGFGANGNSSKLREFVLEKYDRFIFTEDDNVFSPAFLDYINKGLEKFKEDKSVLAICGYRHFYNLRGDIFDSFIKQNIDFSAWGYGMWKDRFEEIKNIDHKFFANHLSIKTIIHIKKIYGNSKAIDLINYATYDTRPLRIMDRTISIFMILSNKNVIMPLISCVRNWGVDGSGENYSNTLDILQSRFKNQEINKSLAFQYVGTGEKYYDANILSYKHENIDKISNIKFYYLVIRIFLRTIYFYAKDISSKILTMRSVNG